MKKQLLIFLFLISATSSEIFALCNADFTWTQTAANIITFTNTSTGTTGGTSYQWNFADATSSSQINPVHTFSIPGVYMVCLTIHDSLGCNSTFCDSVIVTGVIICNVSVTATTTMASCSTCTDGTATAVASNGTAPYNFTWNTVPPQVTNVATGLAPGNYTVCVTDANACTACQTVTVGISTCQASYTWMQPSNNNVSFTNTSTGTSGTTHYSWTFGDAGVSSTQNPTHYYTNPGTYTACLHIWDSTFCYSTICSTFAVTGVSCNSLAVTVTAVDESCPTCLDGSATANPTGGTAPFTYLWSNLGTTQSITGLAGGNYSVTVTDAVGCTVTGSAVVDSMGGCDSYFTLTYVSPQTYNGINLANGAPPLSYLWSWGDATTSNTAYPTHTYSSPGFYFICLTITDALGCTSTYCDSFNLVRLATPFSVVTVTILPPGPQGVGNVIPGNYCTIFPNPASGQLFIDYSLAVSANTQIVLYDMLGNVVRSFRDDVSEGKHEHAFDINSLEQGLYMLSLKSREYMVTKPISVVK